jgi:enoyl-CoA hydratase/carnithine racemase
MLPSAGGTQSLARVIGAGPAAGIVMLGETMDADEARRRRVVDLVVDGANAEARELAARMAACDPVVVQAARRSLRAAADLPLESGLRRERLLAAGVGRRS